MTLCLFVTFAKFNAMHTVPVLLDLEPLEYGGRDPHMPIQKIPKGEVDVAAIARSIPAQSGNQRLLFNYDQQHIYSNRQLDKSLLRKQQPRQLTAIVPGEGWASKWLVFCCNLFSESVSSLTFSHFRFLKSTHMLQVSATVLLIKYVVERHQ